MAFTDIPNWRQQGSPYGPQGPDVGTSQQAATQAPAPPAVRQSMPSVSQSRQMAAQGALGPKMPAQQAAQQAVARSQGLGNQAMAPHSQEGWDFSNPGVAQQYFDLNAGRYQQPGQSNNFFNNNALQSYQNQQPATNYAGQAYQDFASGAPANLDPYYANAKRKLGEDLNQQFASRGAYGSSVALDRLAEGMTDLNAQQANREGDYALQRYGLGGQLGAGADAGTRANSANALSWTTGVGQLAQGADQADVNRLNSGMNAASAAEEARRQRGQDYYNNINGAYGTLAGLGQKTYDTMLGDEQSLLDAQEAMQTGLGAEYLSSAQRKQDQQNQSTQDLMGLVGMFA